MKPILVRPEAAEELAEAVAWYESREPGVGDSLLNDYLAVLDRLRLDPERPRLVWRSFRKVNLRRFPYAVIYRVSDEAVMVEAVAHLARRPFYWRRRI